MFDTHFPPPARHAAAWLIAIIPQLVGASSPPSRRGSGDAALPAHRLSLGTPTTSAPATPR